MTFIGAGDFVGSGSILGQHHHGRQRQQYSPEVICGLQLSTGGVVAPAEEIMVHCVNEFAAF